MFTPPGSCPVCATDVHARATACPNCGADDRSGWRGVDFPEEAFDYQSFLSEEFGGREPVKGLNPLWSITALVLLLAALFTFVLSRFPF